VEKLEFCSAERAGRILTVTIRRPEVLNALHPPASAELARVFDDFTTDPELWVAILTGEGERAFCAGNDLKYQASGGAITWPESGFGGLTSRFDLDKPVICAVNGLALGGGFELVLACDLAIASQQASFGLPEVRVGLAALAGGLHRLPRAIPLKPALGIILTGRRIDAQEAARLGLVNEVVAPQGVTAAARRLAEEICEAAPLSVRASKQAALQGLTHASLQEAMSARYPAIGEMVRSQDFVEGPRAFAEKRRPRWQGR
jgi:enoyl-CoA hydratase/carnithine racemase